MDDITTKRLGKVHSDFAPSIEAVRFRLERELNGGDFVGSESAKLALQALDTFTAAMQASTEDSRN